MDPSSKLVSILSANEQTAALMSKFDPSHMPHCPQEGHDLVVLLSWSADGSKLAMGTSSSVAIWRYDLEILRLK